MTSVDQKLTRRRVRGLPNGQDSSSSAAMNTAALTALSQAQITAATRSTRVHAPNRRARARRTASGVPNRTAPGSSW